MFIFEPKRIRRHEYTCQGRRLLFSTVQTGPEEYESMVFLADTMEEVAARTAVTEFDARCNHADLMKLYPEDWRSVGKYAKLRDDLIKAMQAGRDAEAANPEDGGTCNHDSVALELPRWIESKVERAAEEAGTYCHTWHLYGTKMFVFSPDSSAQANARTRNAEAMEKALEAMGYNTFGYSQMD